MITKLVSTIRRNIWKEWMAFVPAIHPIHFIQHICNSCVAVTFFLMFFIFVEVCAFTWNELCFHSSLFALLLSVHFPRPLNLPFCYIKPKFGMGSVRTFPMHIRIFEQYSKHGKEPLQESPKPERNPEY